MKQLIICSILIFIGFIANAQIIGKSILELRQEAAKPFQASIAPSVAIGLPEAMPNFHYSKFPLLQLSNFKSNFPSSNPTVPIVYSYHNLAFFCKVEVKMEKAAKLPIKFRLGDVDYVDKLEGKRQ